MGNPAHTATQGVNLRIQGPKHPPIGPNTPPIPRAMPPSTHARTRPTPATNARHALAAHTRTKWRRPRHVCTDDAGNGADNGTTPRDLAALTPRCTAGPYRWSMGNPAHTATQGVNLRNQGPKHTPQTRPHRQPRMKIAVVHPQTVPPRRGRVGAEQCGRAVGAQAYQRAMIVPSMIERTPVRLDGPGSAWRAGGSEEARDARATIGSHSVSEPPDAEGRAGRSHGR